MRQKALISGLAISTVSIGITTYLLKDKSNFDKIKGFIQSVKKAVPYKSSTQKLASFPIHKAGHPDPMDTEDNKMVSEGSMFPVQYYNEKKQ
ncbi:hypothetical protein [Priestia megaterium]|jgi:hypothetical protein|uniref:YbyB n=1 Tax=Priestia megaterium TaxID=1404 RepID=A0A3D8WT45_PRIMG|nr:hypothetical protein [Priestia megaterium]MDH3174783.1 hypothetical protein [Priestia megaterium]MDY0943355.1 hypothetical protein [Priestia megaterium]MED4279245.1 hypothetical protein [Priestia megaterium]MED4287259.1 hypothetical protein [Priestia megaterium]MED4298326.1 hypothetical protein [Priestia megaterium]